jgi:mRNA-degrading endonuclease RelE of RelBE toxin-antitoxin system
MEVELTAEAVAQLQALPSSIVGRIDGIINRLRRWPDVSGVKRLTGNLKGNFRVRTGGYRVIFRLDGQRIIIWRIADRRDVYED